jgi:hypothetical protein
MNFIRSIEKLSAANVSIIMSFCTGKLNLILLSQHLGLDIIQPTNPMVCHGQPYEI